MVPHHFLLQGYPVYPHSKFKGHPIHHEANPKLLSTIHNTRVTWLLPPPPVSSDTPPEHLDASLSFLQNTANRLDTGHYISCGESLNCFRSLHPWQLGSGEESVKLVGRAGHPRPVLNQGTVGRLREVSIVK